MISMLIALAVFVIVMTGLNRVANRGIAQADPASARDMVEKNGAAVVDVRNPGEFSSGHIPGAVSLPLAELENRIHELAPFRKRQILLVCLSGNRSMAAGRLLRKNGFSMIANLRGGMTAWAGRGYSVIT